jgi:hypothetical protein
MKTLVRRFDRYWGLPIVFGAIALSLGTGACGPDKILRGTSAASGGVAASTGGIATGGQGSGGISTGGAGGGMAGGTVSTGGYTYIPQTTVASGGTTTVTWSTLPGNKDAAVASVCFPAPVPATGPQHQILMVVKSIATPGLTPALLKPHLEARGFKVDYAFIYTSSTKTDAGSIPNLWFFDDAKTKQVDVNQYGLAVITKDGYKSGANLDNIPVLCGNNQTADSALAMATSDGSSSSTKSAFTIIDAKHPIAANHPGDLAGTIVLETGSSPSMKVMLATVPATAHVVAVDWNTPAPGTSAAALFAYNVGDILANGAAAKARRVGFFLDDSTSWGLVTAGSIAWEFFDASVDWLLGLAPCSGSGAGASAKDASAVND